jgi:hypothetical protein
MPKATARVSECRLTTVSRSAAQLPYVQGEDSLAARAMYALLVRLVKALSPTAKRKDDIDVHSPALWWRSTASIYSDLQLFPTTGE